MQNCIYMVARRAGRRTAHAGRNLQQNSAKPPLQLRLAQQHPHPAQGADQKSVFCSIQRQIPTQVFIDSEQIQHQEGVQYKSNE
ncbi:hypothetical protein A2U01_0058923 [Trifolium medium]|uniref:Uncharacterized protein n=1 Tax=Trifolium medium TaxID=97028 RepID=A0A392RN27_9FABA|nr:hypothetical protein [Trifolium medium]